MTQKSNTGLGRDILRFWTAVIYLIAKNPELVDFVIKVVSYGSRHSKFRIQLSPQG